MHSSWGPWDAPPSCRSAVEPGAVSGANGFPGTNWIGARAPTASLIPSLGALRGDGLVVFEVADTTEQARLRVLQPDLTSTESSWTSRAPAAGDVESDGSRIAFGGHDLTELGRCALIWESMPRDRSLARCRRDAIDRRALRRPIPGTPRTAPGLPSFEREDRAMQPRVSGCRPRPADRRGHRTGGDEQAPDRRGQQPSAVVTDGQTIASRLPRSAPPGKRSEAPFAQLAQTERTTAR